ncbi:hypothetical protein B0T14DRAFT_519437 [Immersiella caudata]|uniref:Uncharacterized protein n=1 Tax=Immersiella caudata TaxID=314043 RepID=A0AA40BZT2_9PEZI|nr:hypothetical protein B0T14DRAFT_519437 [Immersiella caudata]
MSKTRPNGSTVDCRWPVKPTDYIILAAPNPNLLLATLSPSQPGHKNAGPVSPTILGTVRRPGHSTAPAGPTAHTLRGAISPRILLQPRHGPMFPPNRCISPPRYTQASKRR